MKHPKPNTSEWEILAVRQDQASKERFQAEINRVYNSISKFIYDWQMVEVRLRALSLMLIEDQTHVFLPVTDPEALRRRLERTPRSFRVMVESVVPKSHRIPNSNVKVRTILLKLHQVRNLLLHGVMVLQGQGFPIDTRKDGYPAMVHEDVLAALMASRNTLSGNDILHSIPNHVPKPGRDYYDVSEESLENFMTLARQSVEYFEDIIGTIHGRYPESTALN